MNAWGYHLVLDINGCDKNIVTSPEEIKKFSKDLVKFINMIPYGEPQVVHFCDHVAEKAGWTLVQLIETSNIMCHFCDANGDAYLDIFSCKFFDKNEVVAWLKDYLKPKYVIEREVFYRDADILKVN